MQTSVNNVQCRVVLVNHSTLIARQCVGNKRCKPKSDNVILAVKPEVTGQRLWDIDEISKESFTVDLVPSCARNQNMLRMSSFGGNVVAIMINV